MNSTAASETATETQSPIVAMIVAVARNGVIGHNGDLPWRLSSDLKMFRRLTMGKPLIMGRRTFQSLGKPLDGRDNIILTRDPDYQAEGAIVVTTIEEALAVAKTCAAQRAAGEIMVIGGAQIYEAARDIAQRIYWTDVEAEPPGDTFFSKLDPSQWNLVAEEPIDKGPRDEYSATLKIYERQAGDTAKG